MPQPARNTELAEQLIRLYQEAQQQLLARYQAILNEPRRARQTARLRELITTQQAILDGLVDATRTWTETALVEVHASGAAAAARAVGSSFAWTAPHVEAVQELAGRTFTDAATRLQDVSATTRRALQDQLRDASRAALLENKTATQAGKDLARAAADDGLFTVRYANGATHTVVDWADSAVRTVTAEAYNQGTLTQCRSDGIEFVEYFDGPGCCVGPGHSTGPLANGLVVRIDDVVSISHPRCRRSIGPRPDITTPAAAQGARRTAPVDGGLGLPPEPAAAPGGRQPRTARAPRTARSARSTAANPVAAAAAELAARAAAIEPSITAAIRAVTEPPGALTGLSNRIKTLSSLVEKLTGDMLQGLTLSEAADGVRDAVRYTLILDEAEYWAGQASVLLDLEGAGHIVVRVKNFWGSPGYRGINAVLAIDGYEYEIQFHTSASFDAKTRTHVLYEQLRGTGLSAEERIRVAAEMDAAFDRVVTPPGAPPAGQR